MERRIKESGSRSHIIIRAKHQSLGLPEEIVAAAQRGVCCRIGMKEAGEGVIVHELVIVWRHVEQKEDRDGERQGGPGKPEQSSKQATRRRNRPFLIDEGRQGVFSGLEQNLQNNRWEKHQKRPLFPISQPRYHSSVTSLWRKIPATKLSICFANL